MTTFSILGGCLFQWDTGRRILVETDADVTLSEVHYSTSKTETALVLYPGEDGTAPIPDLILQDSGAVRVYAVTVDAEGRRTFHGAVFRVMPRAKPSDYVYTEEEFATYKALDDRIRQLEENGVSEEQLAEAVNNYLDANPVQMFETDKTLTLKDGVLSVNTANVVEEDNTLPVTSAAVHTEVGNINALLATI